VQYVWFLPDVYYGGRLRDFDEFMDSKNETVLHGSNINNEAE
jgi:hypothetical protein